MREAVAFVVGMIVMFAGIALLMLLMSMYSNALVEAYERTHPPRATDDCPHCIDGHLGGVGGEICCPHCDGTAKRKKAVP